MNIFDNIATGVRNVLSGAWNWGADLITNFVNGITANISAVVSAATSIGQTIKDYIGFSEPDKGPLSNFHTFAPDMMELFADGIEENSDLISKAFDDSLSDISGNLNGSIANVRKIGDTRGITAASSEITQPSSATSAPSQTINVSVSVGSIASDYDTYRMTDQMVMQLSAQLAKLQSRQTALVGG